MSSQHVEIQIDPALIRKLQRAQDMGSILEPAMHTVTAEAQKYIARYPRKAAGAFSAMATPGQKRAYWAKVRAGEIQHREGIGYVRTGNMGRKWTTRVRRVRQGVEGELGTNSPGAEYVFSARKQQPFHKASGFRTDEQTAERMGPIAKRILEDAIKRAIVD